MSTALSVLFIFIGIGIGVWLVSFIMEARADAGSIPPALMQEMYLGHYRAFLSLLRNAESWETATKDYGRIDVPVLLIWGDRDWAKPSEREHDRVLIPNVQ